MSQLPTSRSKQRGFTIVELLIVIVIIGILATITIVAYNGIQERSRISSVNSALGQARKKLATYQVDNPDTYPADKAALGVLGIKDTDSLTYQYTRIAGPPDTYCLTATNATTSYKISSTTSAATTGGCAGHGQGGVAAVTNVVANPSFETSTSLWSPAGDQGSPTIARAPTGPTGSYHLTVSKAAPVGSAQVNYIHNGATANTTYFLGFWAWADSAGTANVQLARNNIGFSPFINLNLALTTTPTFFSATGVSPADTSQLRLRITPKTDGLTTHYDGFIVVEGSTMTSYADGNSTDWAWNGSQDNSSSTGPAK
ncbi:MAG: prepilin-type N-terminal cleavage/methylation domain-containing protein [Candidatus Saccharimonadales bacterium]